MFLIFAIYNRETFHNHILSFAKVGSKFCQNLKSSQKLPKTNKILKSGEKFAKSSHELTLQSFA